MCLLRFIPVADENFCIFFPHILVVKQEMLHNLVLIAIAKFPCFKLFRIKY